MKPLHLIIVPLVVLALAPESRVQAQMSSIPHSPTLGAPAPTGVAPTFSTGRIFTYSYYAAPERPREYVGLGGHDTFPFYGQPHGHVYDRWSWWTLSGWSMPPARFYYPPLR